ncbi:hypothetical protein BC629DRAFT_1603107 [Irpex lacteus]|nr:hypothetical protein BC629DRAFT_1603107 [Irpex lacteus]
MTFPDQCCPQPQGTLPASEGLTMWASADCPQISALPVQYRTRFPDTLSTADTDDSHSRESSIVGSTEMRFVAPESFEADTINIPFPHPWSTGLTADFPTIDGGCSRLRSASRISHINSMPLWWLSWPQFDAPCSPRGNSITGAANGEPRPEAPGSTANRGQLQAESGARTPPHQRK